MQEKRTFTVSGVHGAPLRASAVPAPQVDDRPAVEIDAKRRAHVAVAGQRGGERFGDASEPFADVT